MKYWKRYWYMILLCLAVLGCRATAQTPPVTAEPEIRVEYFGSANGYVVGQERVELLCVVRNVGAAGLPADTMRLRCYALTGLDYTDGDTWPMLPALSAGQAVAYRWVLSPVGAKGPLVAAALLQSVSHGHNSSGPRPASLPAEKDPQAVLRVIPRLNAAPSLDPIELAPITPPNAETHDDTAWIGNDRAGVRFVSAQNGEPLLLLGAKSGGAWQTAAIGVPLSLRSGEDGQVPWNQTFKWEDSRIRKESDGVTLILRGTAGTQWRAEIQLTARKDTAVMQGNIHLTARRAMRLYSVQLPRLLAADAQNLPGKRDGSPIAMASESPVLSEATTLAALSAHGVTFGLAWPSAFAFPDWHTTKLPEILPPDFALLGAAWNATPRGTVISYGATLDIPFRLFALAPSDSAKDALRFLYPERP